MKWSSRSLGFCWQHLFFALLLRCHLRWLASLVLMLVVFYYSLCPRIRHCIYPYLEHRFPRQHGFDKFLHCLHIYYEFGKVLLQRMAWRAGETRYLKVNQHTKQILQNTINHGKGCIILSAHLGSWQLAIAGIEELGYAITILQYQNQQDVDKHYFEQLGFHRIHVVNATDKMAWLAISTALRRGEVVCLMGDRLLDNEPMPIEIPFLGDTIRLPGSVYWLSAMMESPVLVCFSVLQGRTVHITHTIPLAVPQTRQRNAHLFAPAARAYVQAIESFLMDHPHQFFNFYDMWDHDDQN